MQQRPMFLNEMFAIVFLPKVRTSSLVLLSWKGCKKAILNFFAQSLPQPSLRV